MQKHLRPLIGYIACAAGIALMATYFGSRAWSTHTSNESIDAMRRLRVALPLGTALAQAESGERPMLSSAGPDMSTWSARRIAEYRDASTSQVHPEAVLQIPRLKVEVAVFTGTSDATLNRGAGRIEGTSRVDSDSGNIGIAAHRDGFFRPLKDIAVGDLIQLETVLDRRDYQVTSLKVVDPSDVSVLDPTPDATLTLVTCYPFYHVGAAPQRFVVHARVIARTRLAASAQ
jgi:sortase A